jgi:hypothetical protein
VREPRFPVLIVAAALVATTSWSCRTEKMVPPAEDAATPAPAMRPLTSRDGADAKASEAPTPDSSLPPGHPPVDGAPPTHADAGASVGGSVAGTVTVTPNLQSRAGGGVLFVIARSGPDRRIVAVRRESGATFPFAFHISGADAMIAGTSFSGPLEITARLSQSGDAVAAKGDIEGIAKGVAVGATDVKIALDTVHE